MTYSIVACDPVAGEVGFAIASCSWDCGGVGLAKASVGAIVSQGSSNPGFIPQYFERLKAGDDLDAILSGFRESYSAIGGCQVGLVTQGGASQSFTGTSCSLWSGHHVGNGFACQGNILVGPEVISEMAAAYERTEGELFDRLYAALQAGDDAGGDNRGKQSARLLVAASGKGTPGTDTRLDLRIPDHPEPVREIGRLLDARRTFVQISKLLGEEGCAEAGEKAAILDRLQDYLQDKRDRRYLDAWATLSFRYLGVGQADKAIGAMRTYLTIAPQMVGPLRESVRQGDLPAELTGLLDEFDPAGG